METIYFLILIGVCALAVVWATRGSKADTDLSVKRTATQAITKSELLNTSVDNPLSHKEEIWERRRKQAAKDLNVPKPFVPKFEATAEPEYDGYSRRDRHHLTKSGHVAEEAHIDEHEGLTKTGVEFDSEEHASQA